MINLLGAAADAGRIIGLVVLLGLAVAYIFFGFRNRKKQQEQVIKMISELKKGDKVVTNAGIYGEIVSLKETNMGKVIVIKTGDDEDSKKASYITINATVVVGIDQKQDLVLDENGNVIDPVETEALKEEVLKEKAEKPEEENKEENKEEPKKKTTKKKTTKKAEAKVEPKAEPATADTNN